MVGAQQQQQQLQSSSSSTSSSISTSSLAYGVGDNGNEICTNPTTASKNQLEHLNTMREAIFSQDGWGCQYVNQDINWDVPGSPEKPVKVNNSGIGGGVAGGSSGSTPTINNGTDIWKANLQNGCKSPTQPVQKTSWDHIPSTNLGGTWGENDCGGDSAIVWTDASLSVQSSVQASSSTGNHLDGGGKAMDTTSGGPSDMHMIDQREQMRGDIRGISGRLNGSTAAEMWEYHNLAQGGQMNKTSGGGAGPTDSDQFSVGSSGGQWGTGGGTQLSKSKDLSGVMTKQSSGWEEISPSIQRMQNFDDGTSLWGQQSRGGGLQTGSHWKDVSDIGRNITRNPGASPISGGLTNPQLGQTRLGSGVGGGQIRPDANMWGHTDGNGGRTTSWDTTNWGNGGGGVNQGWSDPGLNELNHGGFTMSKPQQQQHQNLHQQAQQQQQHQQKVTGAIEMIRNSNQYRMLINMGMKIEDIEFVIRSSSNIEEAIEILNRAAASGINTWRRNEDHRGAGFDRTSFSPRYGPQQLNQFQPQQQSNNPNLLNNIGGGVGSGSNSSLPATAQKYLNRGAHNLGSGIDGGVEGRSGNGNSQPSTVQVRILIQEIQMAVSAGYLHPQILNQPLSPSTLVLLNQLLANIKRYSHLQQLQMTSSNMNLAGVNNLQLSIEITKIKKLITNLHNQIAAQQAVYLKQQKVANIGGDYFRSASNQHDQINSLQGPFADMTMNKIQDQQDGFQRASSQQSRLNQWKLPALNKDGAGDNTDFSYKLGTTAKSKMVTSNSTIGSLGLQGDGTWASGRNDNDDWPDSAQELPSSQVSPTSVFADFVLEFEPGKPWRGPQIKTIEDDPSITPGSVSRSPFSIRPTEESDLFATSSKTSSTDVSSLSLSSSTWSFNPTGSSNSWSNDVRQPTATTSDLWGAPMNKTAHGPPPGLGSNKLLASGSGTNDWIGNDLTGGDGVTNWVSANNNTGWPSSWLLLKNLTAQIDGSILRTLCMQHGPLQQFHLYLNQCIALCKYSSHEEASKAQKALNNCVLGNTTIFSESPSEIEVQNLLQRLGGGARSTSPDK